MSYCRWSSGDLYVYRTGNDRWVIHVGVGNQRRPHDGDTFTLKSPGTCADQMEALIALGYKAPRYAIDRLRKEQKNGHSY